MIFGVGIDMTELSRIEELLNSSQRDTFLKRIAHPEELKIAPKEKSPLEVSFWAGRFASKEAFSKALGTGLGESMALKDVGILKNELGAPIIHCSEKLKKNLQEKAIVDYRVSISHTSSTAVSIVILSTG